MILGGQTTLSMPSCEAKDQRLPTAKSSALGSCFMAKSSHGHSILFLRLPYTSDLEVKSASSDERLNLQVKNSYWSLASITHLVCSDNSKSISSASTLGLTNWRFKYWEGWVDMEVHILRCRLLLGTMSSSPSLVLVKEILY